MTPIVTRHLRPLIQASGLMRKELSQTLRQPQLILLLAGGPFVILVIFGLGYDEEQLALRTRFIGPTDSIYATAVDEHSDLLSQYVIPAGFSDDIFEARRDLEDDEIDLIVIFPDDAEVLIADGEQAPITILHNKLDPVQLIAVEVASRLAVGEVNATILEQLVGEGLDGLRPLTDHLDDAVVAAEALEQAEREGDSAAAQEHYEELDAALIGAETALGASALVIDQLAGTDTTDATDSIEEAQADIRSIRRDADPDSPATTAGIGQRTADVAEVATTLADVPPNVIVRPFYHEFQHLGEEHITSTSFFSPSTIALLVAHLGLTFAAMSVIADRRLGVFEIYRVAPMGPGQIVFSKYLAFLLLGAFVAAALLAAVVLGLGVPMLGAIPWVVVGMVGMLLASIGLGLIVSALANTDIQAVQYSMLVLLAGLFFGGFFLDLSAFATPVQALAQVLPVTHGISVLQDVMLRGVEPDMIDLISLAALTGVYGIGAMMLMRWQLRA